MKVRCYELRDIHCTGRWGGMSFRRGQILVNLSHSPSAGKSSARCHTKKHSGRARSSAQSLRLSLSLLGRAVEALLGREPDDRGCVCCTSPRSEDRCRALASGAAWCHCRRLRDWARVLVITDCRRWRLWSRHFGRLATSAGSPRLTFGFLSHRKALAGAARRRQGAPTAGRRR